MREWMTLFVEGKPLYPAKEESLSEAELTANQVLEEEKQRLLDEVDFTEYRVSKSKDCDVIKIYSWLYMYTNCMPNIQIIYSLLAQEFLIM